MTEGREVVLALREVEERQAIYDLLQELNMIVHHAESGQEAIYLLEDYTCQLLMMDVQLSDMHAWKMLRTLKESVDLSTLPTVVIMDEQAVIPLPNVTSVVRPVSMEKLRQIIGELFPT